MTEDESRLFKGVVMPAKPKRQRKGWQQRIAEAEKRGHFTRWEQEAADHWNTCAVGERIGFPKSEEIAYEKAGFRRMDSRETLLLNLGYAFQHAVEYADVAAARDAWRKIQAL